MRQFRADNKTEVYFDYRKLYQSTDKAHLIDVNDTIKFWIPRAWITKFSKKKKRIHRKKS